MVTRFLTIDLSTSTNTQDPRIPEENSDEISSGYESSEKYKYF